jgi:hypothetical protein
VSEKGKPLCDTGIIDTLPRKPRPWQAIERHWPDQLSH